MKRTYQVVSKWLFLATLPLFLVLVTYPGAVIRHTFGPEYVAGGATLAVLAVGFFSHVVAGPSGDTLTALGRTRTIMADNVAVVCVNVALNLYLIPRYGFLGAALATTVGFVLLNGLYLAQLYHATGIHPFRPSLFAPAAVAVVVWAALAFGAQHLGGSAQSLLALGGHLTVFALSYPVVVLWFGGVEPEERRLLERLDGRTGVDLRPVCRLARRFEE